MICAWGYDFETPHFVSSVNRIESHILKVNMITRLIAVGSVALTCFVLSAFAYFIDISYTEYIFKSVELPYSDFIKLGFCILALLIATASLIYQRALTQLNYQKANLSIHVVNRAKKFNLLFNIGVILFALCLDMQIVYAALYINI